MHCSPDPQALAWRRNACIPPCAPLSGTTGAILLAAETPRGMGQAAPKRQGQAGRRAFTGGAAALHSMPPCLRPTGASPCVRPLHHSRPALRRSSGLHSAAPVHHSLLFTWRRLPARRQRPICTRERCWWHKAGRKRPRARRCSAPVSGSAGAERSTLLVSLCRLSQHHRSLLTVCSQRHRAGGACGVQKVWPPL